MNVYTYMHTYTYVYYTYTYVYYNSYKTIRTGPATQKTSLPSGSRFIQTISIQGYLAYKKTPTPLGPP